MTLFVMALTKPKGEPPNLFIVIARDSQAWPAGLMIRHMLKLRKNTDAHRSDPVCPVNYDMTNHQAAGRQMPEGPERGLSRSSLRLCLLRVRSSSPRTAEQRQLSSQLNPRVVPR